MIRSIRNRSFVGIFVGLLFIILSKIFFQPVPDFPLTSFTPLVGELKLSLSRFQYLDIILGISFILLQAGLFNFILLHHKIIKDRSLFPFIIYAMLAAVYSEQFYLNPASFLNFFLILITERMIRLQEIGKNPGTLFLDIGTLIGLSFLFSKETIFYIPFIIIGIIIIYSVSSNNIIMLVLSGFMVVFISGCIYYLIGHLSVFWSYFYITPPALQVDIQHWQARFYLLLIILIILSAISYFHFQFTSTKISNKIRRLGGVFAMYWLAAMLITVFQVLNLWVNMALSVIPITVFLSNYFQEEKGIDWLKNLILILLVLGLVSIQLNY